MKVVLFCGGLGMRLREFSDSIPKPMVHIGYRPILWSILKYYSHFGHNEFILCLGYKGDCIKDYFVNYNEYISDDFVYSNKGKTLKLLNSRVDDWRITFVDTGMHSNIGERLLKIRKYLENDEVFLANYSDGLTDMNLDVMIKQFYKRQTLASFMAYKPNQSFHVVSVGQNALVTQMSHIGMSGLRINTGYFVLRREIFDYIKPGEELVDEPFQRLIKRKQLSSYKYNGFWASMDTFKDKQLLDDMYTKGDTPWEVWRSNEATKTGLLPAAENRLPE